MLLTFYVSLVSMMSVVVFGRCLFLLLYSKRWSNPDGYLDEFLYCGSKVSVKSIRRIPNLMNMVDWEAEFIFNGGEYRMRSRYGSAFFDDDAPMNVQCAFYRVRNRWRDGLTKPVTLDRQSALIADNSTLGLSDVSWSDVSLSRSASNTLQLASGDNFLPADATGQVLGGASNKWEITGNTITVPGT